MQPQAKNATRKDGKNQFLCVKTIQSQFRSQPKVSVYNVHYMILEQVVRKKLFKHISLVYKTYHTTHMYNVKGLPRSFTRKKHTNKNCITSTTFYNTHR